VGRVTDTLDKILLGVAGIMLVVSALLMTSEVVRRYLTGSSILWAEEVITIFMVYMSFLVAGVVLKQGAHVRMEVVFNHLPVSLKKGLVVIISVVGIAISAFLFWSGVLFIKFIITSGVHPYTATHLDPWVIALGFPLGMAFLTFYFVFQLYTFFGGKEVAGWKI